jgi:predicted TIM-barrel fold metal-dependent hydrolase
MAYKDGKPGGFDPHKRIPDMDADGIDAVFLYPSLGLFSGAIRDPELAAAVCRAYNRWLADYCKPYPDRLFGVAMLPMQSIDLAIAEMRFARKELGFRGGFLRPNPYNNKMIHHPDYEPFWAAAEDLDFSTASTRARRAACRRSASIASRAAARSTSYRTRWR